MLVEGVVYFVSVDQSRYAAGINSVFQMFIQERGVFSAERFKRLSKISEFFQLSRVLWIGSLNDN